MRAEQSIRKAQYCFPTGWRPSWNRQQHDQHRRRGIRQMWFNYCKPIYWLFGLLNYRKGITWWSEVVRKRKRNAGTRLYWLTSTTRETLCFTTTSDRNPSLRNRNYSRTLSFSTWAHRPLELAFYPPKVIDYISASKSNYNAYTQSLTTSQLESADRCNK